MDRFGSTTKNATGRRSPLDITPHLAKLNRSCRESYWKTLSPDDTRYDQPEVGDALRFGVQYPNEQCESPIVFPHEPWTPPDGSTSFVLVLRIEEGKARGLSYTPHSRWLNDWWTSPRIALRKRASTRS